MEQIYKEISAIWAYNNILLESADIIVNKLNKTQTQRKCYDQVLQLRIQNNYKIMKVLTHRILVGWAQVVPTNPQVIVEIEITKLWTKEELDKWLYSLVMRCLTMKNTKFPKIKKKWK